MNVHGQEESIQKHELGIGMTKIPMTPIILII